MSTPQDLPQDLYLCTKLVRHASAIALHTICTGIKVAYELLLHRLPCYMWSLISTKYDKKYL
ncbi:hypothetical protein ACF3DV_31865 [Chlorogloeopsis fritschii PCC 9212]|uniref:hypothetical protein n=1 Tax=Chlorogloeopsis fritschii TaxID=1124 RepID=UPI00031DF8D0|nr:hypothetical protein [Chlorogloeopsis fritschii]